VAVESIQAPRSKHAEVLVVDEAHHLDGTWFRSQWWNIEAHRRWCLTATPDRWTRAVLPFHFRNAEVIEVVEGREPKTVVEIASDWPLKDVFSIGSLLIRAATRSLILGQSRAFCREISQRLGITWWSSKRNIGPLPAVATYSLVGEGLHIRNLEAVLLVDPPRTYRPLLQNLGRGLGKDATIITLGRLRREALETGLVRPLTLTLEEAKRWLISIGPTRR